MHRGATFVAANYKNTLASATAIDNWSEFAENGTVKDEFLLNCSTLLAPESYRFLEQDCFTVTRDQLPAPINVYLYDGEHSFDAQRKALTHFYAMLDVSSSRRRLLCYAARAGTRIDRRAGLELATRRADDGGGRPLRQRAAEVIAAAPAWATIFARCSAVAARRLPEASRPSGPGIGCSVITT